MGLTKNEQGYTISHEPNKKTGAVVKKILIGALILWAAEKIKFRLRFNKVDDDDTVDTSEEEAAAE